ncbi:MAG TPA: hypothetical protein PLR85_19735 [Nitrospira sp.]|nr:hypothetical protein [Nitrospira sp.]
MTKCRVVVALLVVALIGSNAWWAYRVVDAGITQTYMSASLDTTTELLDQTLAVLPVVARPDATRQDIIDAARVKNDPVGPFEKEGYVWVGQLGLQFSAQGKFIKAVTPSGLPSQ